MAEPKSPVVPGLEPYEYTLAKNQPEYVPLPVLRGRGPEYVMLSRWTFTPEERKAIFEGADIIVQQLTFGALFQPSCIYAIASGAPSEQELEHCINELGFKDELDERLSKITLDNNNPFS